MGGEQELKRCMGKGLLGTMWMGMWQETEVAAKVLHELPFLVPDMSRMQVMEEEVRPPPSCFGTPGSPPHQFRPLGSKDASS